MGATGDQNSLFSIRNVIFALVILFVGILIGAFLAPRFSSLPTFLGGFPETKNVEAGDRHVALKTNTVIALPGDTKSSSIYMEDQGTSETPSTLCSFAVNVKYDASKIQIKNLLKSETLPKEFTTFSAQNDEKNQTIKIAAESKDCNAQMTPQVMELATFDVVVGDSVQPGYSEFDIVDTGEAGSSQIVGADKKDIMTLNDTTQNGLFVSDNGAQTLTTASPATLDGALGGTVTVKGNNVYSPYYIQGAESNVNGQKVYYFQNIVPGDDIASGLLSGGIEPGQYYVCSRSLYGIQGENVCSLSPLLTVQ